MAPHIARPVLGPESADTALPEFPSSVAQILAPVLDDPAGPYTIERSFLALRIQLAHGGVTRRQAARLLQHWQESFKALWPALAWLADLHLTVRTATGYGSLRGLDTVLAPLTSPPSAPIAPAFAAQDAVIGSRPRCHRPTVRRPAPKPLKRLKTLLARLADGTADPTPDQPAGTKRVLFPARRTGPLRKKLLRQNTEEGERVANPFVDKVARLSEGLPLYVEYVIDDILANNYRILDAGESLPPSLDAYHEKLLRWLGIGDLHQVLTPLAATLAVAREPLSAPALADLLHRRGELVPASEPGIALVRRVLGAIQTMLRAARTPEGEPGYVLYHYSLA